VAYAGTVFSWGDALLGGIEKSLSPTIVEGFGGTSVRNVVVVRAAAFAIGEDGELFSWGRGEGGRLGHGDAQDRPSPKRVERLWDIWVSNVAVGSQHAVALAEDGLVYAWGKSEERSVWGPLE
jgi:E3 ubiquitin-protein ligase HERC2